MMRSLDGAAAKYWQTYAAPLTVTCFIVVGLGTGTPHRESSALAEEAGANAAHDATADSARDVKPSLKFMDLASSQLAVVLRPRELAQSQSFGPLVSVAQPFVQEQFESTLGPIENKPPVCFEAIEFIAYSLRPKVPHGGVVPKVASGTSAWENLTFELAIRFARPTDCVAWAAVELPNAERVESDGLACVRIKAGDSPEEVMHLVQLDPFTAIATSDKRRLKQMAGEERDVETPGVESELFDGNAIACTIDLSTLAPGDWEEVLHFTSSFALFVFREGSYSTSEQPDPVAAAKQAFVDGAQRVTFGIGVLPESEKLVWRALFHCTDKPTAAGVRKSVEFFQAAAKGIVDHYDKEMDAAVKRGELNNADDLANAEAITFTSRLLSDAMITPHSTRSPDDALLLESSGAPPKLLLALFGMPIETFHPPTAPVRMDSTAPVAE